MRKLPIATVAALALLTGAASAQMSTSPSSPARPAPGAGRRIEADARMDRGATGRDRIEPVAAQRRDAIQAGDTATGRRWRRQHVALILICSRPLARFGRGAFCRPI